MNNSNVWVETEKYSRILPAAFLSSRERRLAWFSGGTAKVKPVGEHWMWPLESIDAIGLVMMKPAVVSFSESTALASLEGVPISVTIEVVLCVRDDDTSIAAAALFAEEQERVMRAEIFRCFQVECKQRSYLRLHSSISDIASAVQGALLESALVAQSCFEVLGLTATKITSNDEELARTLVQRARALQQDKIATREARAKKDMTRYQIESDEMLEKAHEESVKRKRDAEREEAAARAQILKTPEGLLAMDVGAATRFRELELEKFKCELEQNTRVKLEEVRVGAIQLDLVKQIYKNAFSERNIRTQERAATLTAIVPAILKGVTNVSVSLPQIEDAQEDIDEESTDTPSKESPKDS